MKTLFTFVTVVCSTVRDKRLTNVESPKQSIYLSYDRISTLFFCPTGWMLLQSRDNAN